MNPDPDRQRCDSCGESYEPHLGRDGLCFACATHLGCGCADDPETQPPSADLHQHVAAIAALVKPSRQEVEEALGIELRRTGSPPYGDHYAGGPSGVFQNVVFKTSRDRPSWLAAWEYDVPRMPQEHDVDLSRYGRMTNMRVDPPELNSHTFTFEHLGFRLFVSFHNVSRRLCGAALHRG